MNDGRQRRNHTRADILDASESLRGRNEEIIWGPHRLKWSATHVTNTLALDAVIMGPAKTFKRQTLSGTTNAVVSNAWNAKKEDERAKYASWRYARSLPLKRNCPPARRSTAIVHLFAKNVRKRDTRWDIRRHIHVVFAKKLAAQEYFKLKTYNEQSNVECKFVKRVLARKRFICICEKWQRRSRWLKHIALGRSPLGSGGPLGPSPLGSSWVLTEWQIAVLNYRCSNTKAISHWYVHLQWCRILQLLPTRSTRSSHRRNFWHEMWMDKVMKLRNGQNFSQSFLGSA